MLRSGPWSLTYGLGWKKKIKKEQPLFSKNVLKIFPIHVYKFSFFNTSNTYAYRVWSIYFWPYWKPLVWETQGRLLSEVFERKADYFILATSSKKTIPLRHQEWKKYMKCCENHIFMYKLSHFYVFFYALWIIIRQFTIKVLVKRAKQSISAALD